MREFFLNHDFIRKLDSKQNLIAFNSGVSELDNKIFRSALPEDYLSLSVGYNDSPQKDHDLYKKVEVTGKRCIQILLKDSMSSRPLPVICTVTSATTTFTFMLVTKVQQATVRPLF